MSLCSTGVGGSILNRYATAKSDCSHPSYTADARSLRFFCQPPHCVIGSSATRCGCVHMCPLQLMHDPSRAVVLPCHRSGARCPARLITMARSNNPLAAFAFTSGGFAQFVAFNLSANPVFMPLLRIFHNRPIQEYTGIAEVVSSFSHRGSCMYRDGHLTSVPTRLTS